MFNVPEIHELTIPKSLKKLYNLQQVIRPIRTRSLTQTRLPRRSQHVRKQRPTQKPTYKTERHQKKTP